MANCQCMEKEGWVIDYHVIEHACFGLLAKGSLLQLFKPAYTHIFGFWKKKVTSSRIDRLQAKERLPMWCAGVKPCSLFLRCIAGCRRGKGEKLMKQGSHPSSIVLLLLFPTFPSAPTTKQGLDSLQVQTTVHVFSAVSMKRTNLIIRLLLLSVSQKGFFLLKKSAAEDQLPTLSDCCSVWCIMAYQCFRS